MGLKCSPVCVSPLSASRPPITTPTAASTPPSSKTASFTTFEPHILSSPEIEEFSPPSSNRRPRHSFDFEFDHSASSADHFTPTKQKAPCPRRNYTQRAHSLISTAILRPPAVRLANPVNYVPRITPVKVPPHPLQFSDENLPLEAHRDAYPLLSIPERRRSRVPPSPTSLLVERSQGETESGRSSIAVPRGQGRSGTFNDSTIIQEMPESTGNNGTKEATNPRQPERAHIAQDTFAEDLPRHAQSHTSLRSQVPSNTGPQTVSGEAEVAEELAWGPAHPCYPHMNPHVPTGSEEYLTTRIIRIRRDWMVKGDLAPTFSNLYPEILDPLLSEQEFRRVIATVNDELTKAFDPFGLRNWIDGALGLVTGWFWEDIGAPGIKSHLKHVESWLENWNREVGARDGVRIWSLRRTAYMSLDIQIPDPKVGIIQNEASLPGTRPSSFVGRGV